MGQLVFILGRSGTGKSYSMRNFPPEKYAVINVQGKLLPFRGAAKVEATAVDQSDKIVQALKIYAKDYKVIVVDDYQYVMANEFMRRSTERGFDKFTDIGRHAWDIANAVRELPDDIIVYVMCHTDRDDEGNEKIKTIGKLLDEKICLEGMSTIVLKTNVTDGVYSFLTQNNGRDTTKSPHGMFPSYAIENDLYYVDQKIRNYYGFTGSLTDEEMAEIDEAAKKDDIPIEDGKKRRGRRSAKKEEPTDTSEEEKKEEVEKSRADANDSASTDAESKPSSRRTRRSRSEQPAEDVSGGVVEEKDELANKSRKKREPVEESFQGEDGQNDQGAVAVSDEEEKPKTRRSRKQMREEQAEKEFLETAPKEGEDTQVPFEEDMNAPEPATASRRRRRRG